MQRFFRECWARPWAGAAAAMLCALAGGARAADEKSQAPLTVELRSTTEFWRNTQGGLSVGGTTLNKVQASFHFAGDAVGWRGFSAYAQVFKTNSESLSLVRTGDIQTVSNIEAPGVERLFEFWASQAFGAEDAPGFVAIRVGLIDLNRTFDSIEPAAPFINSSHGIGPDLSRSSQTGPSIFPVTGPSAQVDWRPSTKLLAHVGVFALPDPDRQNQFVDLHISSRIGAVVIGQLDYAFAKDAQASIGVWRNTAAAPSLADPARRLEPRPAVYAFVEGPTPLPGQPSGWVRAGVADGRVQAVDGYLGAGLVWKGLIPGRPGDGFGVAVAHAAISRSAQTAQGLPATETALEASYGFRLNRYFHLQPDVQRILHPAGRPHVPDATVIGLRIVAFGRAPAPPGADD
jgi:porin